MYWNKGILNRVISYFCEINKKERVNIKKYIIYFKKYLQYINIKYVTNTIKLILTYYMYMR